MAELERYHKRYFDTRPGEVALTCCALCGAVVWNPDLHERTYHSGNQSNSTDQIDTAKESGADDEGSAADEDQGNGGGIIVVAAEAVQDRREVGSSSSGRDSATERPVSSPPARGAGRTTAAGSGRKGSR